GRAVDRAAVDGQAEASPHQLGANVARAGIEHQVALRLVDEIDLGVVEVKPVTNAPDSFVQQLFKITDAGKALAHFGSQGQVTGARLHALLQNAIGDLQLS